MSNLKRGRQKIKRNPNDKVTLRVRDIDKIKQNATVEALEVLTLFPLLALRDTEGFGKKRLLRFKDKFDEMVDSYYAGYITLEDIRQTLIDEVDIEINRGG